MKKNTRKHYRKGGTSILMIGFAFFMLLLAIFFLEVQNIYDAQYSIEVRAQRAINMTVEDAMDDKYRQDGLNYMDIEKAKAALVPTLNENLGLDSHGDHCNSAGEVVYHCDFLDEEFFSGKESRTQCAGIKLKIKITLHTSMGSHFGTPTIEWTAPYESTNFRTDDDQRSGR